MKNQDELPEEEIENQQQFPIGRKPEDQGSENENDNENVPEEKGYTSGEIEFADGEGTQLDEKSEMMENDKTGQEMENDKTGQEKARKDADVENTDSNSA
jgi:hypothetical protein